MLHPKTLTEMAVDVLTTADGREKAATSRAHAATWQAARGAGEVIALGAALPPDHPSRPAQPELLSPRDMPKRKSGSPAGRQALLHAIAHIELNAVDLHWDIIARFAHIGMPMGFYDDWVRAADEESKHFNLLSDCLEAMGSFYGKLPAHDGMWRAAADTADDFQGRLAIVPMVLEARGLDVTPGMITLFEKQNEQQTVDALNIRRGSWPCCLWIKVVQLLLWSRKHRSEGSLPYFGQDLFQRRVEAALQ